MENPKCMMLIGADIFDTRKQEIATSPLSAAPRNDVYFQILWFIFRLRMTDASISNEITAFSS